MSDEMLAQMLQLQFDQEYDRDLGKVEAKYNGSSKGKIISGLKIEAFEVYNFV